MLRSILLAIVLFAASLSTTCSPTENHTLEPPVESIAGEELFQKLVAFSNELHEPLLSPFYAGISFKGKQATSYNLRIFLLDDRKRDTVRVVLKEVFGEDIAGGIELVTWKPRQTMASQELIGRMNLVEEVTIIDYDERVDRMMIGVKTVDAVGELEHQLRAKGIARSAVMIKPMRFVQ